MILVAEPEVVVEMTAPQWDALYADAPFSVFAGGLGSGKTWGGARWILDRAANFPDSIHLVTINSFPQAHDVVIPELEHAAEEMELDYWWTSRSQQPTMHIQVGCGIGEIRVRSTFKPAAIRGGEYGSWWGDEVRDALPLGLKTAKDRLRCKKVDEPQYRLTTTTNGHDFVYERHREGATLEREYVVEVRGKRVPVKVWRGKMSEDEAKRYARSPYLLVQTSTDSNPHVREGYAESIADNHDKRMTAQERDAEFVVQGDVVYYAFNRSRDVAPCRLLPGEVIVCLDFNNSPCLCLIAQEQEGMTVVVGEIATSAGTPSTIAAFQRRFPNTVPSIYGDPQGYRRTSQGGYADYVQWEQAIPGARSYVAKADPGYATRASAVNARIENGKGERRLVVDPSCRNLIEDLETVTWDSALRIDKRRPDRTHASDALAYYLAYRFPCERPFDRQRLQRADARSYIP